MNAMKSRRTGTVMAAVVIGLLLPVLQGSSTAYQNPTIDLIVESGTLTVSGTSNVHDWTCEAKEFDAELQVRAEQAGEVPSAVARAAVTVPVEALDCGSGRMNDNLRKALATKTHPTIVFAMTGHEIVVHPSAPATFDVIAKGTLTIAGSRRPVELKVEGAVEGNRLRIRGSHELMMTEFGVKPPTAMLGTMKTGDRVTVQFDLAARYGAPVR